MPHRSRDFFPSRKGIAIPVEASRRRSITTPSRRRRIIYETARHNARLNIQHGFDKHIWQSDASIIMQSLIRRFLARSRVELLRHRRDAAILRIQSKVRCLQAQKKTKLLMITKTNKLKREIQAATIITSFCRKLLAIQFLRHLQAEKQREMESNRMATTVQRYIRGAMARSQVEEIRLVQLHKECAAIVIQSFVRSTFAKYTYISSRHRDKIEPSVYLIQRAFRMYLAVQHRRKLFRSIVCVQQWWRRTLMSTRQSTVIAVEADHNPLPETSPMNVPSSLDESSDQNVIHESAIEIQSNLSVHESCSEISYESEAPIYSQEEEKSSDFDEASQVAAVDDEQIKLETLRKEAGAKVIQRAMKLYQRTKRLLQAHNLVHVFVDCSIDLIAKKRMHQMLTEAATKLQAFIRGYLGRRKAASITQALYSEIMSMYEHEFSTDKCIPDDVKAKFGYIIAPPTGEKQEDALSLDPPQVHPAVYADPFISEFLKLLPQSSMPMAGCDLEGIDLNDPNNLITVTVDFSNDPL